MNLFEKSKQNSTKALQPSPNVYVKGEKEDANLTGRSVKNMLIPFLPNFTNSVTSAHGTCSFWVERLQWGEARG